MTSFCSIEWDEHERAKGRLMGRVRALDAAAAASDGRAAGGDGRCEQRHGVTYVYVARV